MRQVDPSSTGVLPNIVCLKPPRKLNFEEARLNRAVEPFKIKRKQRHLAFAVTAA